MQFKSQSAMEYLITYGWAVLIIAIVIAILFELGIFNSTNTTPTCVAQAGFLCSSIKLDSLGVLSVTFGQSTGSPIMISGIGCSNSSSAPASFSVITETLQNGQQTTINFNCHSGSSQSGQSPIGSKFSGTLWIEYNTQSASDIKEQIGSVSGQVVKPGDIWVLAFRGILELSPTGALLQNLQDYGSPMDFAIDGNGNIWLLNQAPSNVLEISPSGAILGTYDPDGVLEYPQKLAIDGNGNIWVTNAGYPSSNIIELSPTGALLGNYDPNNLIDNPSAITIDGNGNIWVANGFFPSNVVELSQSGTLLGVYSPKNAFLSSPYTIKVN